MIGRRAKGYGGDPANMNSPECMASSLSVKKPVADKAISLYSSVHSNGQDSGIISGLTVIHCDNDDESIQNQQEVE